MAARAKRGKGFLKISPGATFPSRVFPATESSGSISFNQASRGGVKTRIQQKRWCSPLQSRGCRTPRL